MIINVRQKGRVQHLSDSRLLTLAKRREPGEKIKDLPANTVALISFVQLMKTTILAESFSVFSPSSLCYTDIYRRDSGRCHTLPFCITFFNQIVDKGHIFEDL